MNENQALLGIKKADFELLKIIQILQEKAILKTNMVCDKYNKNMILENNKNYINKCCERCRGKELLYDIRTIRKNSIF